MPKSKRRRTKKTTPTPRKPTAPRTTEPRPIQRQETASEAKTRHLRYAQSLIDAGVTFRPGTDNDRTTIETLVHTHIDDMSHWTVNDEEHGVMVARDRDQSIIGVLVARAVQNPQASALYVQHLVVVPEARGRGIGVVMLGIVEQLLPAGTPTPTTIWGQCEARAKRWYEKAGFTVLAPQDRMRIPLSDPPVYMVNSNPTYSCWFYR